MELKDLKKLSTEEVLEALGLERRRGWTSSVLPAVGLFGAGLLIGAAVGLMLAPKPGSALRSELVDRVRRRGMPEVGEIARESRP